jgi:hypothetical protein
LIAEKMKRLQKIIVCLLGIRVLCVHAATNGVVSPDNPYAFIAMRNVFGLKTPTTTIVQPAQSPPKITPNGIMSIFGQWQVLFKVSKGQSKDAFYILNEGERQDDIEVMHIDKKAAVVTFNNHGVVQEIPLDNTQTIKAPILARNESTSSTDSKPYALPESYPPEFIRARTPDYLGGGPDAAQNTNFQTSTLEERIVLIEAQRAYLKSQNDPAADSLPPTALTPTDGSE